MLDADGWCLMMVLYMVLSDILAERRMARRTQVRCKGCFTFTGASLADSGLLQVGLFLWWLCMLSFLSFCIWERTGKLKREGGEGAEKDSMHTSRQRKKMPQKMTATCHTRPQASLHKYKAAGINERQQEHTEPGAKILMNIVARTAGWISSLSNGAGWISSLSNGAHWRKPTKKARAGCRNLSSTTTASQPKKADIIQCALSIFAGGPSGARWRGECLMKCLSQDVKASCSV